MRADIAEPPPLELTVVVEPFDLPTAPARPPAPTGAAVNLAAVATVVSALVFAALTWWALGG